jgi:uncharacterized membrane protein YhaH (DUF805 family)
VDYYVAALKKYAEFGGRARRAEYWMFTLFNVLISIGLSIVDAIVGTFGILSLIYGVGVFIPGLAVTVRRLHDTNRSGWWMLIALIPLIGIVILIIFLIQDSDPGDNRYGRNPKGVAGPTVSSSDSGMSGLPGSEQRLQDLETLRMRGLITDAEYEQKRKEILASV